MLLLRFSWFFITLLALTFSNHVVAHQKKIVFSVNAPGTNPYLYFDQHTQTYQGIVVDFFATIDSNHAFSVEYLDTSRNRYEKTLLNNQADLFLSSSDWLQTPNAYLLSETIALHNSHLYSTQPFDQHFDLKTIDQTTVCTRTNFVYPTLNELFKTGTLIRVDSTDQSTMTSMLLKGRCQYLVFGKEDAHPELFSPKYCQAVFFESPAAISSVEMVFVIRHDRRDLLEVLNHYLRIFVSTGKLEASFQKHIGSSKFPKERCDSSSFTTSIDRKSTKA